ncbi:MAG TPA: MobF family relaxase, partial [Acidimicrobiales bacterium]|nr:MobF family relaxase [Acidimicrobiales bacterium]
MLSIGRIFAGGGWRYLAEQVSGGAEDYYSADVARGESPGRWSGGAAYSELGLTGTVSEEEMHRVFGLLLHPTEAILLGRSARIYRPLSERLEAARRDHRARAGRDWVIRQAEMVANAESSATIEAERTTNEARISEEWAKREAAIRRGGERRSVAGFDLTFSPPKSLSVLWAAADTPGREAIWAAHHEGVEAALAYLEREAAWSRTGYNGIRQVDTTGWVVASFDHRMSRAGDVQIHTHNAVLNRVRCADGQWRSLDGPAIYRAAASAGAIYDRVREAALERDLGVRHEVRVEGGPREIVGVDTEICALFSSRRTQVKGQLAEMVTAYTETRGSEPSQWIRARMSDWATLQTRQRKEGSETTAEALARWAAETRDRVGGSLAEVWAQATEARLFHDADLAPVPSDEEVLTGAIEAVETTHSTWTRYDLARAVTLALPVQAESTPEDLLARVDTLVGAAVGDRAHELGVVSLAVPAPFEVPERLRRGDGASVYVQHGAERYATAGGLMAERRVLAAAGRSDGPVVVGRRVGRVLRQVDLGLDQELAVRAVLGSGRPVEAVLGPAGVGKTTTMGVLARAWSSSGRPVMGLAPSETAARVLGQAAGIHALNTAKLCWEHAHASPEERATLSWPAAFGISPGALVILDEAAMASRMVLDEVTRLTTAAGAKLVLMGDHHQLEAPEASGLFRHLVESLGAVELSQVRRFAAAWEAAASLRLRAGDVTVLEEYELRSRIVGGSVEEMEAAVLEAALADEARGLATFVLADTNEAAAGLSGRFRDALVEVGRVDDAVTVALADGNRAGVGDRIVTRQNDRTIATTAGSWVANRDRWEVIGVHGGGITAARLNSEGRSIPERVELEASYLATSVELAYAGTVHSSQGVTTDITHTLISPTTSRAGLYVGLTRGALANHAYVICTRPEGADQDGPLQDPLAVLAGILEREEDPLARSALATAEAEARRAVSLAGLFPIWSDLLAEAGRERWMAVLSAGYDASLARAMVDSDAWGTLAARLRRIEAAGIDAGAALVDAAGLRGLEDADDIAAVLHWRLRSAERSARLAGDASFAELCPSYGCDLDATLAQVAAAMDARVAVLAETVATDQPAWATGLGLCPQDDPASWLARAGAVAGYREAFGWEDPTEALGPRPAAVRADARAWWERAALALGHSEAPTLAGMPTEHLEAMIQAAAAELAPPSVATELAERYAQLRAAHTAQGVALLAGNAARAAGHARWAAELAAQITALEAAHAQRVAWSGEAGRRVAQVSAARAELSARQEARAQAPRGSWTEVRLHRAIADARLGVDSMTRVAAEQEEIASGLSDEIEAARTNLDRLVRLRPAVRAAAQRVSAEANLARRLDTLDAELAVSRMDRSGLRGRARAAALSER